MQIVQKAQIPPSATMEVNNVALQKRHKGERVYNLAAGEPMVDTDPRVVEAANKAMQEGKTHYAPVAGIPELLDAVSVWMNQTYGCSYERKDTLVTCGGKFGLNAICQSLLNDGDEAIISSPYWVSYPSMVKLYGGVPKIIDIEEDKEWKMSPEDIRAAASERTKFIVLDNASNPTGALYTKDELYAIVQTAKELNITVVSDEVYSGLVYDSNEYISCGSFADCKDNVIVVHSCSKNFAMTGWRVGFLFGPEPIVKAVKTLQGQSTTGTSTISQWAAVTAFQNADTVIPALRDALLKRRNAFVDTFNELFPGNIPYSKSSMYVFLPISAFGVDETDSVAFCKRVIEEANVATVPGAAFGKEGYVRCSFGESEEEIKGALNVLSDYLKR